MKVRCKYCKKKMAASGIPAHISARHRVMVLAEFRSDPLLRELLFTQEGRFIPDQLMLPAPSPLTIYSRRALGKMAAPIPEHRRPKGYQPPTNYARPSDLIFSRRYVWER